MQTVQLDLLRVGIKSIQCSLIRHQDPIEGHMLKHLVATLVGEIQEAPLKCEWPASWWQHFKQDWFPKWALKRWPVVMQSKEWTLKTIYPFLKTALPAGEHGPRVTVMANDKYFGAFIPECDGLTRKEWNTEAKKILFREMYAQADKCPCCRRALFEERRGL